MQRLMLEGALTSDRMLPIVIFVEVPGLNSSKINGLKILHVRRRSEHSNAAGAARLQDVG